MGAAVPRQDRHRGRGRDRELIRLAPFTRTCLGKDAGSAREIIWVDWTRIAPLSLNAIQGKDDAMGKEKNKGGKEARKPKKEVPKTIAANPSTKGAANSK